MRYFLYIFLPKATAAIDVETDSIIQKTIRQDMQDCTILTIAHRIGTIMDYDRILVLDQGKIVEFDSPSALLALPGGGMFFSLCKESGLA
jgi:ABC-type multidrug transport system fused ATPase/permease subunit